MDPYKILGVAKNSTDEQIKAAYRELAKKYHPDSYSGNPLADLAAEKMKEINEAYDTIMNQRKGQASGAYSANSGYGQNSSFADVRKLIMQNRFFEAEQLLDSSTPTSAGRAEWHFLKGSVFYNKGWLEEAYRHWTEACRLDPSNLEYSEAKKRMTNQRRGGFDGYAGQYNRSAGGCNTCDMCAAMMCTELCCDCGHGC